VSSIEERIVRLKFDNQAFEQGVATSRNSLGQFTKQLETPVSTKGLDGISEGIAKASDNLGKLASDSQKDFGEVDNASKKLSLDGIGNGIAAVSDKFKAMSIVGVTALATITNKAVSAGLAFAKSFSTAPIFDGFHEYETNLNSIQTILANTQASGATLKDVENSLNDLNHYSDQTIYNFSEMAKNIGTFTAAGVDLKTSAASIKGIANLAALSGSNSEQASGAMYQLSQAISAGRVSLEDWNSVVNAGMGGTVFQRALAQTAEKMGTLKDGAVKLKGPMKNVTIAGKSFRESITAKPGQESWLTSKVLTATLAQFTGDLSDAQLKAQGFSAAQIKAIQAQAKTAKEAATQVKTFSQLVDTTKEAIGSGWSQTFQTIFGDFTEAKGLFTGISNAVNGVISKSSNARNKMLSDWKKLGGRDDLIKGITNGVKAFASVIKPIHDAFRQIFPATTGKQLADMTKKFAEFMGKLKIGSDTAGKLKRAFAGVFAIFGIAWDVIKGVGSVLAHLFGVITKGSGGFLNLTARIGDFLVGLKKSIESGDGLTKFFQGLGTVLAAPIKLVQAFAHWIAALFEGFNSSKAEDSISGVTKKLNPFAKLLALVRDGWSNLLDLVSKAGNSFGPISDKITSFMQSVGPAVKNMFSGMNFNDVLNGVNSGLFAGLILIVKKFIDRIKGGGEIASGFVEAITGPFEALTGTLKTMQGTLKATTLLEIALAIGILTLSVAKLSRIDANGLTRASTAMAGMFTQLIGSLAIFQKFIGTSGFIKMPFVMGSLILLAGAVLLLAQAVKQLSTLDWNSLSKGLTGVTVLLGGLLGVMKFMPPSSGMISTGLGIIALAGAIKILASAVGDLSGFSWTELAKGLVGVGSILGALALFTRFAKADAGGIAQGVGIVLLAAGIKILVSAVKDMAGMPWKQIAKGLASLAGTLGVITAALMLIPPTAPLAAAGVLLVAISLGKIGDALAQMAQMSWPNIRSSLTVMFGAMAIIAAALYVIPPSAPLAAIAILGVALSLKMIGQTLSDFAAFSWEEIAKAVTLLAATLGIIAGAMLLMTTALPGAAALLIVSAALTVLQPVLASFGNMSLGEIGKSLLMLAGVFVVFGAAALLLTPVIPMMIALGFAIVTLGAGMLAAGAGVFLFSTGLAALAAVGAAGSAVIIGIVSGLIGLIPKLMEEIGLGIVAFAKVIATAGPAIFNAMTVVIGSMIKAIAVLTPQIVSTLLRMLVMLLNQLANYVPKMVSAGMRLIIGVLNGIAANIGKMVTAATNVVVNFINGISKNLGRVIDAGIKLVIAFVNGVANGIRNNQSAMNSAGKNLASAIIEGMVSGLHAGLSSVISAAKGIASSAIDAAKGVLHVNSPSKVFIAIGKSVNEGFVKGLKSGDRDKVNKAFDDMKKQLLDLSKSAKATAAERKKAASAYTYLSKNLSDEHAKINALNDKYDSYTQKIKDAQQALADAKKTRDDYNKSITDEFSALPSIDSTTTAASYEKDLTDQIEKTKEFSNALQRLRKMGLSDTAYKELLSKGISALPFVNDLLSQGQNGVNEINSLDKQLETIAANLGKTASSQLYDAAVNSAAGLVKGLQDQQKAIEKQMDIIADAMVKAIKKKLGIKSPSTVFAEVGGYSAEGVAVGLSEMSGVVAKAAAETGQTAIDSLRESMSGFSDLITGPIDIRPVVTPVLDLSSIRKNAGSIGTMLGNQPISVDSAYSKAAAIANARLAAQEVSDSQNPTTPRSVTFIQNNNSPKALSSATIYRQTNNQISKAKGALTNS
jgi:tape measure domain-containing protein